jgi:hypothetical protein
MRAADFSAWLSAIAGLSARQRREALEAASGEGGQARSGPEVSLEAPLARRRGAAAARTRSEQPVMSASRTRAVRIAQAERSSAGAARMGFCGFAARAAGHSLTNTPMAHLRKKERWLDHARARIEGKSLAKTAQLCGVHPTTAFRWRHRFRRTPASDKPRMLRGIVEAGETFVLESFKGRWSDLPRKGRQGPASGPSPGQHPRPRRPRPERRDFRRGPASGRQRLGRGRPRQRRHARQSSHRRRNKAITAFARRAGIPFHTVPPRESQRPRRLTGTSITLTPTTAA